MASSQSFELAEWSTVSLVVRETKEDGRARPTFAGLEIEHAMVRRVKQFVDSPWRTKTI